VLILTGQTTHWVMTTLGTKRWDTCAPAALLAAAGGFLVDKEGHSYDYSHSIATANNDAGVMAGGSRAGWHRLSTPLEWTAEAPSYTQ
jgi:3'(2'), 5'-bisphosphate nucleotidase